jgi:hypothetical protein
MEAYKLEFDYFSGVEWKNKTVEVIGLTEKEIEDVFFEEMKWSNDREEADVKWNRYKNKIEHIILKFPLVNSYTW